MELLQWLILLCCEISQDQPFPEQENGFQARIRLEGINHQHPSVFCVLSVAELRDDVAAAAKSLQSCLTLCDPTDGSPPGSPVPGILQARTLEWVAISFSNA